MRTLAVATLLAAACAAPPPPPPPAHAELLAVTVEPGRRWTAHDFLPLAYVPGTTQPLFTEFVLTPPAPEQPTIRADWLAALDATFDALTALDELGRRTDRTFDAWVGLPYPSREQPEWGDGLDFRLRADRQAALAEFVDRVESRWGLLQRVRLAGFVWTAPAMWETTGTRHWEVELDGNDEFNTDEELVRLLRRERRLIWIANDHFFMYEGGDDHQHLSPWATHNASGTPLFDEVFLVPDREKWDRAAEHARLRGAGIVVTELKRCAERPRLDSVRAIFRGADAGTIELVARRRGAP